jgi:hypothetical protein
VFSDNLAAIAAGKQRLMAHHAADAPAVDVTVVNRGGAAESAAFPLLPGDEKSALVAARPGFAVSMGPAGSGTVLARVVVEPGNRGLALIYAVGSAKSGSVTLLSKILPDVF